MIAQSSTSVDNVMVRLCSLVEHPGGHDGGEFPQYEEYGVASDGSVFYNAAAPKCSSDSFVDEQVGRFVTVTNRRDALSVLYQQLDESRQHTAALELLVRAFEQSTEFSVYFEGFPYDKSQATTTVFDFDLAATAATEDEEGDD